MRVNRRKNSSGNGSRLLRRLVRTAVFALIRGAAYAAGAAAVPALLWWLGQLLE